jgi:hypothetical protein
MRTLQANPETSRLARKILIEPNSGCWLWEGNLNHDGYGRVTINYVSRRAHTVVYELLVGPVPEGKELHHLCKTPPCCNPLHLEPLTRLEHVKLGSNWPLPAQALMRLKTHCPRGHAYDEANTYFYRGSRTCRKCRVLRTQEYYKRKNQ